MAEMLKIRIRRIGRYAGGLPVWFSNVPLAINELSSSHVALLPSPIPDRGTAVTKRQHFIMIVAAASVETIGSRFYL